MIIHPEVFTTPDYPTIKFREPKEKVDLDMELPKILHTQGWSCGTYFKVQFVNHDKTELLASAEYVVNQEIESMHVNDANPYQPMTKTIYSRKYEQISEWWYSSLERAKDIISSGNVNSKVVWNPGKQVHQLKINDEVVFEDKNKQKVLDVAEGNKAA